MPVKVENYNEIFRGSYNIQYCDNTYLKIQITFNRIKFMLVKGFEFRPSNELLSRKKQKDCFSPVFCIAVLSLRPS